MRKENKQLAQQKRAEQRKKQATKNLIMGITKIGIPVLAVILLVVLIIVDPLSSAKTNKNNNNSQGLQVEGNADTTSKDTSDDSSDKTTSDTTSKTYTPPELDANLTYYADINIKDHGTITVKLDQASAPISSANFVALAKDGFYDGLTFHRIMEGFMMQGGDPKGNGTGGSENNIVGEFTSNGYDNKLSHTRGAISMARATDPNSASSQFFIVHEDSSASLDGNYAVFGYVTEGIEIVDTICESAKPTDNNGTIKAEDQPIITSVAIRTE